VSRRYTLLILPPDHTPAKTYKLPLFTKKLIGIGAGALLLLILGLVGFNVYQIRYIRQHQADYARLKQLQVMLKERENEIAHLNEQTAKTNADLDNIAALEKKVANILKLQPPSISILSRGSIKAIPQSYSPSLGAAQSSGIAAEHLELFQQYYDAALKYKSTLSHTPSILPVEGEITSPYGYRKNPFGGYSSEFHDGVDFACSYGTPVKATADGVVSFSGWNSVYGRKISIDHGNGIVTFYGHNSKLLVKVGDNVKKGDVIAYSGDSGRSTGAHLHYGAIINGKSADPLVFTSYIKEQ